MSHEERMAEQLHDCLWGGIGFHNDGDQFNCVSQYPDDPRAVNYAGYLMLYGRGTAQSFEGAAAKFRFAGERGYSYAQYNLGVLYHLGNGVPQDELQSAQWVRKAADQGLPRAENMAGVEYKQGLGVPMNEAQAAVWFRRAADQGDPAGQSNLGYMLHSGYAGKPPDDAAAITWLLKAKTSDDGPAESLLCDLYSSGVIPKDPKDPWQGPVICSEARSHDRNDDLEEGLGAMYNDTEGIR
jgi:TPR repeat protein